MSSKELKHAGERSGAADDFDLWASELVTSCGAFHAEKPRDFDLGSFVGRVKATSPGALSTSYIATNCSHVFRRMKDIRTDDQDFYYLIVQSQGRARMCQEGNVAELSAGDMVLLDVSKPSDFYHSGLSQQLSIILPRHVLNHTFQRPDISCGARIPHDLYCSRLIHQITGRNWAFEAMVKEEEQALQEAVASLLKPLVSAGSGAGERENAQLLSRALTYIDANLSQGQLSVAVIAKELCVSERTVHRVFARRGMTVARYILELRLERSASALASATANQPISFVANCAGFSDLSHFSRAFKRKYGVPPRAYRKGLVDIE